MGGRDIPIKGTMHIPINRPLFGRGAITLPSLSDTKRAVGTMWCAYAFIIIDLIMLPPVIKANNVMVWVTYIAQTVLQLVLLPIIMVGQNVIQAQNESKAETDHNTLTYLATLQDEQMQELKNQTAILVKLEELSSKK